MPLYEYECEACGERFEVIRKFSDPPLEACRRCGKGPIEKLVSSPAIQFKGAGWYVTDYAGKGKDPAKDKGKDTDSASAGKKESSGDGAKAKTGESSDAGGKKSDSPKKDGGKKDGGGTGAAKAAVAKKD